MNNISHKHKRLEKSVLLLVIFISLSVGICSSIRWLIPVFYQTFSDTKSSFIPIRHAPYSTGDDYFYYSHIREIIDSKSFSYDPITYENKDRYSSQITYSFSLYMSAIGGFLTGKTEHAYCFNYFIYPTLNFLAVFLLVYYLTSYSWLALLTAILVTFFPIPHKYFFAPWNFITDIKLMIYSMSDNSTNLLSVNQLQRTPNILFTNLHLFVFAIVSFLYLNRKSSWLLALLVSTVVGISSLTSVQNFLIVYSVLFFYTLFSFNDQSELKKNAVIWPFALLISAPGINFILNIFFLENSSLASTMSEQVSYATTPDEKSFHVFSIRQFMSYTKIALPPIVALGVLEFKNKKFILTTLISVFLLYLAMALSFGTLLSDKIYYRGAILLVSALSICGFINVIDQILKTGVISFNIFNKKLYSRSVSFSILRLFFDSKNILRYGKVAITLFSLSVICIIALNQKFYYKDKYQNFNDYDFKELCDWSLKNTSHNEVAITLDSDLLVNLPVYSPLNMYVPQAVLSSSSHEERFQRFYEAMEFYGFNEHDFREFVNNILYNGTDLSTQTDEGKIRFALFDLVLFYGKYSAVKRTEAEKRDLAKKYVTILGDQKGLSFKANYLIISDFDSFFVNENSMANQIIVQENIVFKNHTYTIYKI